MISMVYPSLVCIGQVGSYYFINLIYDYYDSNPSVVNNNRNKKAVKHHDYANSFI